MLLKIEEGLYIKYNPSKVLCIVVESEMHILIYIIVTNFKEITKDSKLLIIIYCLLQAAKLRKSLTNTVLSKCEMIILWIILYHYIIMF